MLAIAVAAEARAEAEPSKPGPPTNQSAWFAGPPPPCQAAPQRSVWATPRARAVARGCRVLAGAWGRVAEAPEQALAAVTRAALPPELDRARRLFELQALMRSEHPHQAWKRWLQVGFRLAPALTAERIMDSSGGVSLASARCALLNEHPAEAITHYERVLEANRWRSGHAPARVALVELLASQLLARPLAALDSSSSLAETLPPWPGWTKWRSALADLSYRRRFGKLPSPPSLSRAFALAFAEQLVRPQGLHERAWHQVHVPRPLRFALASTAVAQYDAASAEKWWSVWQAASAKTPTTPENADHRNSNGGAEAGGRALPSP